MCTNRKGKNTNKNMMYNYACHLFQLPLYPSSGRPGLPELAATGEPFHSFLTPSLCVALLLCARLWKIPQLLSICASSRSGIYPPACFFGTSYKTPGGRRLPRKSSFWGFSSTRDDQKVSHSFAQLFSLFFFFFLVLMLASHF